MGREDSDEQYVRSLVEEIVGEKCILQARFDGLRGDPGKNGNKARLPVDMYFPQQNLIVEYHERQHLPNETVKLFDNKQTISGVNRKEQRKLYDQRREAFADEAGIRYVVIAFSDLEHDSSKRLIRKRGRDIRSILTILKAKGIVTVSDA